MGSALLDPCFYLYEIHRKAALFYVLFLAFDLFCLFEHGNVVGHIAVVR